VPAHNEGVGLLPTIRDIKAQLRSGDRLLVVADNCTDDTAAVAAAAEAEVVERNDREKVGKGYALDWGIRYLGLNPPETVIVVDADCRLAEGAIDRLVSLSAMTHRPVQALYSMTAPNESPASYHVAAFAWRVKNLVRPLGLSALNLPCQLMGTGMAFPWDVICSTDLATGFLVEDLKLGLDLTTKGTPPLFCSSASVTSHFPSSTQGAAVQRKRWEQGHLAMIVTAAPRLVYEAIERRNFYLLALLIDMAVPPLSLLGLLVIGMLVIASSATLIGFSAAAMLVSSTSFAAFALAIFLAWLTHGRDVLPLTGIFLIPLYVIRKLPLYHRILSDKTDAQWIRTDRTNAN